MANFIKQSVPFFVVAIIALILIFTGMALSAHGQTLDPVVPDPLPGSLDLTDTPTLQTGTGDFPIVGVKAVSYERSMVDIMLDLADPQVTEFVNEKVATDKLLSEYAQKLDYCRNTGGRVSP